MYWAVVGTWTAIEAVVGWTFTWVPFYNLFKTLIFLYLSLPQSEGSSYIYQNHLAPFFHEHEADIDAFLYSLRTRATTALAGGLGWLWDRVREQLNVVLPQQPRNEHEQYPNNAQQPPTLQDPASGAVQQAYSLLTHYAARYLPVALSAVNAAATRIPGHGESFRTPEQGYMEMPIPRPTPPVSHRTSSRTLHHAQSSQSSSAALRLALNRRLSRIVGPSQTTTRPLRKASIPAEAR